MDKFNSCYEDLLYGLRFGGRFDIDIRYLESKLLTTYYSLKTKPDYVTLDILKLMLYVLKETSLWGEKVKVYKTKIKLKWYHKLGKKYNITIGLNREITKEEC